MSEPTFEFLTKETITAGNKRYETDRLKVTPPGGDPVEVNHIDHECPNCEAIGELAIELRTDSLFCPICEYRKKFHPKSHLVSGVDIGDQPADN